MHIERGKLHQFSNLCRPYFQATFQSLVFDHARTTGCPRSPRMISSRREDTGALSHSPLVEAAARSIRMEAFDCTSDLADCADETAVLAAVSKLLAIGCSTVRVGGCYPNPGLRESGGSGRKDRRPRADLFWPAGAPRSHRSRRQDARASERETERFALLRARPRRLPQDAADPSRGARRRRRRFIRLALHRRDASNPRAWQARSRS